MKLPVLGDDETATVAALRAFAPPPGEVRSTVTEIVAAVARDKVWALQFHPEKSSGVGLGLVATFVDAAQKGST